MKNKLLIGFLIGLSIFLPIHFKANLNDIMQANISNPEEDLAISSLKSYKYEIVEQNEDVIYLSPGEEKEIDLTLKNTGESEWNLSKDSKNRFVLGTYLPRNHESLFYDSSSKDWKDATQIYIEDKDEKETIQTGETVDFSFSIKAPENPGFYRENFTPFVVGLKGLNNSIITFDIVVEGDFSESYNYSIVEKQEIKHIGTNNTKEIELTVENTGKVSWYQTSSFPIKLIIDDETDASLFKPVEGWESDEIIGNIIAKLEVKPGEMASFMFEITSPSEKGEYSLGTKLAIEELFIFPDSIVWDINVRDKIVALTFDDGYGEIGPFLDVLKEEDVKATFFMLGVVAQAKPDDMIRIVEEGHLLASHSYDHPDFRTLSEDSIKWQLDTTRDIMKGITGIDPYPYFRYPYGAHGDATDAVLAAEGWQYFHWTNGTGDYKFHEDSAHGREHVYYYATLNPPDKAVVLMHIISKSTLGTLPDIIDWYRDHDYAFVTVDEL